MEKELKFVKKVAQEIRDKGGVAYYVGGYVRDKFLHKENKDIDVEVYGLSLDKLKGLLGRYGNVQEVGQSFGILMVKGYDIDFSIPRTEVSTGDKHTDFEVVIDETLTVKDATKRRDFTINSVLQDILTGEYVDLYGGIQDINKKDIRYVNEGTFKEDELRVFRASQFSARFNFSIDNKVKEVAKQFDYKSLSKERIFEELNKALLKSDKPSIAFNNLLDMGVVEKLYPELYDLRYCTQSKEHHPEGDVWNHTMMVLDEASKLKHRSVNPLGFMYTALCHDLGKPKTREFNNNRITFYNHEIVGEEIADKFLRKITNETKLLKYVKNMTKNHMKGHKISEMRDATIRKLMTKVDISELILFSEADELGRGIKVDYTPIRKEKEDRVSELSIGGFGKITPYFSGKDLIGMGYHQGKELGQMLQMAYNLQLNGNSKGKIEGILLSRIQPKRKTIDDIVDGDTRQLIGQDKNRYELLKRRIQLFRGVSKGRTKTLKITKKGIPYREIIINNEGNKVKYLMTPLYIQKVSLNNQDRKEMFNVYETKVSGRQELYKNLINSFSGEELKGEIETYSKVYGRLPNYQS